MTYADKYALMKAYKISTGDDPDNTASEEVKYTKKSETSKSETPKQRTPRERLGDLLTAKGIDLTEFAKEKGIDKNTPVEVINALIEELEGNK